MFSSSSSEITFVKFENSLGQLFLFCKVVKLRKWNQN